MTCIWDSGNKNANIALGRLSCVAETSGGTNGVWKSVRGTTSQSTGKFYIEYVSGYRLGNGSILGFGNSSFNTGNYSGSDANSFGAQTEGSLYGLSGANWQGYGMGVVVGVAIDLDAKLVWYRTSFNTNWNNSGTANPATGTGGKTYTVTGALFPTWSGVGTAGPTDAQNGIVMNAGGFSFAMTAPSGFSAWDTGVPTGTGMAGTSPTTWNPSDKNANIALSGGNLVATQNSATGTWCGVRSTTSWGSGKKYFEVTMTTYDGANGIIVGLADSTWAHANGDYPGVDMHSSGWQINIKDIYFKGTGSAGNPQGPAGTGGGHVIGFACDLDRGMFWVKDITAASNWNNSASGDPVAGVPQGAYVPNGNVMYIAFSGDRVGGSSDAVTLNTGATAFTGTIPTGYDAWDAASPQTLTPSLFTNTNTFFAPTVSRQNALAPSLFTDGDTFYSATVTRGSVALLPSLFTDGDTFFSPTVNASNGLTPALFTDSDTFYSPAITQTGGGSKPNSFVSIITG